MKLRCDDVDEVAIARRREGDFALGRCEQGMVFTDTDVLARIPACTTLADDYVAGNDGFAAKALDAKTLRI